VFTLARRSRAVRRLVLAQAALTTGVPLALALVLAERGVVPLAAWPIVALLGPVAGGGLALWSSGRLGYFGYARFAREIRARLASAGELPPPGVTSVFAGVAYGPRALVYETHFDRDLGWLELREDVMVFRGECDRFTIPKAAVLEARLGDGGTRLPRRHRLYVTWREPGASAGTLARTLSFSTPSPEHAPTRAHSERAVRELCSNFESWRRQPARGAGEPDRGAGLPPTPGEEPIGLDLGELLTGRRRLAAVVQTGLIAGVLAIVAQAWIAIGWALVAAVAFGAALGRGVTLAAITRRRG
jgi:hypothetical protein